MAAMVSPCQSGMFIHKRLKVLSRLTKKRKEFIGPELPDSVVHVLLLKKKKKVKNGAEEHGEMVCSAPHSPAHEAMKTDCLFSLAAV